MLVSCRDYVVFSRGALVLFLKKEIFCAFTDHISIISKTKYSSFQKKSPQANYAIMVPVSGQLVEDETLRYVYSADCLEDLEVYNSPNCDEDHLTGLTLHPGSIIRAVAAWTTTTR